MSPEPLRAVAHMLDEVPPEALQELFTLFVGGFLLSRATKREAKAFLAGCDTMASRMLAAGPLIRPARAAARKANSRRTAVEWYRKARSELEAMI